LKGFLFGSTSSPNNIVIKNCNVLNNLSGPNLGGYSVSASAAAYYYFEDCNAKNNASTADTSNVFNFNNLTNLVIRNSSIVNSTLGTTNGGAQGFKGIELINSTLGCVDNLVVSNISAPTTAVVGVDFGATISCHMTDCNITNCLSQGSGTPATGFQVRAGALYNNLIRCVSNNHYATSGGASGFSFTTTTSCSAQDCQAYRNNAAGGSVGFSISASTFYTFIRNSASGHPNNNFSGFNANNFDVPSDSVFDTNFSCTPWTNFGING
jgi:hypothetical protein